MRTADDPAVRLALEHGLLTPPQLAAARARLQASCTAPGAGPRLGEFLIQEGTIESRRLARLLADHLRLPLVDLPAMAALPAEVRAVFPRTVLEQAHAFPYARDGATLKLAVSDPFDFETLDRLGRIAGANIELAMAPMEDIDQAIRRAYGRLAPDAAPAADGDRPESGAAEGEAPAIRLIEGILREAVGARASDIHFEPLEKRFRIRYRVDGVLQEAADPPARLQRPVISRLKLMAGMSIAEKRLPQDGRAHFAWENRALDLRVSSLPTVHGESVVMRLLEPEKVRLGLDDLGLDPANEQALAAVLGLTDGLVLVTGPTGSGKTTTLYACLHHLNKSDRKIITVEDPVEYQLPGINQVPVRAEVGLTFAAALRAMLRQAPNIIMVGEIRDRETAEIAINAALTGHLVFSTLHTNDAPGAVIRLIDLGVKPFLVASALRAVVAQRLVRRCCPHCTRPRDPRATAPEANPAPGWNGGGGCPTCGRTGYLGRVGIFEFLTVDEDLQRLIFEERRAAQLRAHARSRGMGTLREDGWRKVRAGLTTQAEVLAATVDDANGV